MSTHYSIESIANASVSIQNSINGEFVINLLEGQCSDLISKSGPVNVLRSRSLSGNQTQNRPAFDEVDMNRLTDGLEAWDSAMVRINGFGNVFGSWAYAVNDAYNYFIAIYISAFSLGMLAPSVTHTTLILKTSFCNHQSYLTKREKTRNIANMLRNLPAGKFAHTRLSLKTDSGYTMHVPTRDRLNMGAQIKQRIWSEDSYAVIIFAALTTLRLQVWCLWLIKVLSRALYLKRVRKFAERFARDQIPLKPNHENVGERKRAALFQLLPHLQTICMCCKWK